MTSPSIPELVRTFDVVVELSAPEDHGHTRVGHRRVIPIVGGSITGDVEAQILPGGADWQTIRVDGTIEIDGRYSARTADGELLYLQAVGVRSGPTEVLEALLRGDPVDPSEYYFRTTVTIETSSERLAHLQRTLFVTSCIREANTVRYTTYRLT